MVFHRVKRGCWVLILGVLVVASGCANDRRVFNSTPTLPLNYTLVETASGQTIWSIQVPVQHRLVVDFDRVGEIEIAHVSGQPATVMHWRLYSTHPWRLVDSGKIPLQGTAVMQKISYRPGPELPPDFVLPGTEGESEDLFGPATPPENDTGENTGNSSSSLTDDQAASENQQTTSDQESSGKESSDAVREDSSQEIDHENTSPAENQPFDEATPVEHEQAGKP